MDLRYYARAEDDDGVLALAVSERFRRELKQGRDSSDIVDDIKLSFGAVSRKPNAQKLFELLLARRELGVRCDSICQDELVDVYLALEDYEAAISLLLLKDRRFSKDTKPFDVIEYLLQDGQFDAARKLFERFEPTSKILGIEPIDYYSDSELLAWSRQVLHFREPHYVLAALERFYVRDEKPFAIEKLEEIRQNIKLTAAYAYVEGNPLLRDAYLQ